MIIFNYVISMYANIVNMKKENKIIYEYTAFMEALKNNMEYNMTYDDVERLCKDNKLYICSKDIDIDSLQSKNVKSIFKSSLDENYPCVSIKMVKMCKDSEYEAYKITAELKYHLKNEEKSIKYVLFKPNENIT